MNTQVTRIARDTNGNPRYVIHYEALKLKSPHSTAKTRAAGLKMYRGKDYLEHFEFSSYAVDNDLREIMKTLHD